MSSVRKSREGGFYRTGSQDTNNRNKKSVCCSIYRQQGAMEDRPLE